MDHTNAIQTDRELTPEELDAICGSGTQTGVDHINPQPLPPLAFGIHFLNPQPLPPG
ncbi:hypothetical protein [Bradyrhizobium sp.]|uniref:hypothetical protein n=1 Tax=Bradyrhizobium sp. TaxID=376 RepID=UPI003C49566F